MPPHVRETRVRGAECDRSCNVESCAYDAADCFHDHSECHTDADGADYRGTVSHTLSGRVCGSSLRYVQAPS